MTINYYTLYRFYNDNNYFTYGSINNTKNILKQIVITLR